ncbi:MAG TPA: Wzz/FepE/Etk N-terminal domain-containing protein [Patescibacteria group bacterium]
MELKEYLRILKDNAKIFWGVVILVVAGSFAYFYLRPISYGVSLTLNITRQGSQNVDAYKYDDFYRLQADEKFAETIIQWLQSPRTVVEIYSKVGIDPKHFTLKQLTNSFKPEKLSAQIVSVNFSAASSESAKKISNSITETISQNTESLNKNQKENTWFEIVAQESVVVKNTFNPLLVFMVTLAIGIFVAFWIVMISHYIN